MISKSQTIIYCCKSHDFCNQHVPPTPTGGWNKAERHTHHHQLMQCVCHKFNDTRNIPNHEPPLKAYLKQSSLATARLCCAVLLSWFVCFSKCHLSNFLLFSSRQPTSLSHTVHALFFPFCLLCLNYQPYSVIPSRDRTIYYMVNFCNSCTARASISKLISCNHKSWIIYFKFSLFLNQSFLLALFRFYFCWFALFS